ncbi:uncharacterized protein LOC110108851, partial [Dendrobium catenatum]|uniref:uncharacterized protein LOC110108851 n=1 Tax=Dendrobium catenatum TaxID=906689 RepID=UPI0009F6109A
MYNCSSPLAAWIFRKYGSPWKPLPYVASPFWKSICNTAFIAKHCFKFRIVKSAPISLKWDHWIDDRNDTDLFGFENIASIPDIALSNIISDSVWVLPDSFSPSLCAVISGITGIVGDGPCLLWYGKIKSKFKNYLKEFYSENTNCSWYRMVWHKRNALKYSVFAWMALVDGLKTADALRHRQIFVPSLCRLCNSADETVSHLFFD